eukprot:117282-Rhodomonas_salina.1
MRFKASAVQSVPRATAKAFDFAENSPTLWTNRRPYKGAFRMPLRYLPTETLLPALGCYAMSGTRCYAVPS